FQDPDNLVLRKSRFLHRLSPVDRPYFNARAFQGARSHDTIESARSLAASASPSTPRSTRAQIFRRRSRSRRIFGIPHHVQIEHGASVQFEQVVRSKTAETHLQSLCLKAKPAPVVTPAPGKWTALVTPTMPS
ncbi:hypothetical protein, partial [Gluconacetobacter diazotrophicus]|uniref:hypothetical protein n=1 Tax=Gluconacetobacter diazotrophicus TaxID=33996 RepID=UPI001C807E7E